MGIKKLFLFILAFSIYLSSSLANAEPKPVVAVFTVNSRTQGYVSTIYKNTLNLISAEVANDINKKGGAIAVDNLYFSTNIKDKHLIDDLDQVLTNYKTNYSIDYDKLGRVAKAVNADKVIFVTGGYDMRQYFLKLNHPVLTTLEIPEFGTVRPAYKVEVFVSMIDPQNQTVLWDDNYEKFLNARHFDYPSGDFAENVVPLSEIKNFAKEISGTISSKATISACGNSITSEVNYEGTSTMIDVKKDNFKDEITTKDGHSFSTSPDNMRNRKLNNYKNWMKEQFSE